LPDGRGYVYAGKDNMGGAAAGRLTSTYFADAKILGQVGGSQSHTLVLAELPAPMPTIAITDPGHAHVEMVSNGAGGTHQSIQTVGFTAGYATANSEISTATTTTGITAAMANAGGGQAHGNVQPTSIRNKIIKGG
jgi:microcystin-dependent protein